MSLPTRALGKGGPQVTALGFGLMGLSAFYGTTASDEERFKILDHAYEAGARNWDTSDMYGDNEDLLGKWFKRNPGKRENIFLATKFAITPNGPRTDPDYVRQACEKSLSRLGVDSVDLYYVHRVDRITPVEKTIQAMVELKNEGKIKYFGISEVSADTLRRAHAVHPISAAQMEYSPFSLDIESEQTDILRTCRELGIALIAYSPLGRGVLTGQYKGPEDFEEGDFRSFAPRFSAENFPKNLQLVNSLTVIAQRKSCTPGQLSLAWLLAQGDDIIPIPGTKKIKYLDENLGALKVKLNDDDLRDIRAAVDNAAVHGSRYPEAYSSNLFADTPPLSG